MDVVNRLGPNEDQINGLMQAGPDGPIVMVNLLKFRERAEYADGRDSHLTGREAYQRYGTAVKDLVEKHGGRILFVGDVSFLTLGEVEDLWDEVALAEYPNRAALVAMSQSEEWQAISVHREAGLAGQLNIETVYNPAFLALLRGN